MTEQDSPVGDGFIAARGITDLATGLAAATDAEMHIRKAGKEVLATQAGFTTACLVFMGLMARAQGFHVGAVQAIRDGNPYATFTLLRSQAENAAAIAFVADKPKTLDRFWKDIDGRGVKVGVMTNHARKHFDGFSPIYDQLSQYAHPAARSILASHRVDEGDSRTLHWASAPAFKAENDALVACGWVVELAEATGELLHRFARRFFAASDEANAGDSARSPKRTPSA